jgi:hypothetical protein
MSDYKPYYRTDKMKQEELRTAKYVSILFFTMVAFSLIGFSFVLVKAMLYMTGLFL